MPTRSRHLKLQAAPEDFVLDINPQMAATVSEMRLLLRNYNIEINVACNHLVRPAINDDAVYRDYDNLIFKPLFLVRNACNMEAQLKEEKDLCWREAFKRHFLISKQPELTMQQRVDALLVRSIKIIIKEHLKKIAINLPKVVDELVKMQKNSPEEYERYRQYFSVLASNDGLTLKPIDHTNALDRSFGYIFRGMIDYDKNKRKSMSWLWRFEKDDDDKLVRDSIQDIMPVLADFKQLDAERLAWVEEYRSALTKVQADSQLDFVEFFALMLKMDVIVELRNIGMVNYD